MIFDIMQKIAQIVIVKILADIDSYLGERRRRGQLKNTGKRRKTFLTRFGDVSITRTRFRDKAGHARYLQDESLSTSKKKRISLSRAIIEYASWLASPTIGRFSAKQSFYWATPAAMNLSGRICYHKPG